MSIPEYRTCPKCNVDRPLDRYYAYYGQCAICGTDDPGGRYERLLVDHCHKSLKVRGLLCHGCNAGLGLFKDDPQRLRAAAEYLKG